MTIPGSILWRIAITLGGAILVAGADAAWSSKANKSDLDRHILVDSVKHLTEAEQLDRIEAGVESLNVRVRDMKCGPEAIKHGCR